MIPFTISVISSMTTNHNETRLCPQAWPSIPSISFHLFFHFLVVKWCWWRIHVKWYNWSTQNAVTVMYITCLITYSNRIRITLYWIILPSFQNCLHTYREFLKANIYYILEDNLNYRNTHLNQAPCFKIKLYLGGSSSSIGGTESWKSLRTSQE